MHADSLARCVVILVPAMFTCHAYNLVPACSMYVSFMPQVLQAVASALTHRSCKSHSHSELLSLIVSEPPCRQLYLLLHNIDGPGGCCMTKLGLVLGLNSRVVRTIDGSSSNQAFSKQPTV